MTMASEKIEALMDKMDADDESKAKMLLYYGDLSGEFESDEDWGALCEHALNLSTKLGLLEPFRSRYGKEVLNKGFQGQIEAIDYDLRDNKIFAAMAIRGMGIPKNAPLVEAAAYNKHAYKGLKDEFAVVRFLAWSGFDLNAADEETGFTALHRLVFTKIAPYSHLRAVQWLLDHDASPDARNKNGDTPMTYLCGSSVWGNAQNQTLALLLKAGADPFAPSEDGETALSILIAANESNPTDERAAAIAALQSIPEEDGAEPRASASQNVEASEDTPEVYRKIKILLHGLGDDARQVAKSMLCFGDTFEQFESDEEWDALCDVALEFDERNGFSKPFLEKYEKIISDEGLPAALDAMRHDLSTEDKTFAAMAIHRSGISKEANMVAHAVRYIDGHEGLGDGFSVVRFLHWSGFDLDAMDEEKGMNALHYFSTSWEGEADSREIHWMLEHGAKTDIPNEQGYSALGILCMAPDWGPTHTAALQAFLLAKADPMERLPMGSSAFDILRSMQESHPTDERHDAISGIVVFRSTVKSFHDRAAGDGHGSNDAGWPSSAGAAWETSDGLASKLVALDEKIGDLRQVFSHGLSEEQLGSLGEEQGNGRVYLTLLYQITTGFALVNTLYGRPELYSDSVARALEARPKLAHLLNPHVILPMVDAIREHIFAKIVGQIAAPDQAKRAQEAFESFAKSDLFLSLTRAPEGGRGALDAMCAEGRYDELEAAYFPSFARHAIFLFVQTVFQSHWGNGMMGLPMDEAYPDFMACHVIADVVNHHKVRKGVEGRAMVFAVLGLAARLADGDKELIDRVEDDLEECEVEQWCRNAGSESRALGVLWGVEKEGFPEASDVELRLSPQAQQQLDLLKRVMGVGATSSASQAKEESAAPAGDDSEDRAGSGAEEEATHETAGVIDPFVFLDLSNTAYGELSSSKRLALTLRAIDQKIDEIRDFYLDEDAQEDNRREQGAMAWDVGDGEQYLKRIYQLTMGFALSNNLYGRPEFYSDEVLELLKERPRLARLLNPSVMLPYVDAVREHLLCKIVSTMKRPPGQENFHQKEIEAFNALPLLRSLVGRNSGDDEEDADATSFEELWSERRFDDVESMGFAPLARMSAHVNIGMLFKSGWGNGLVGLPMKHGLPDCFASHVVADIVNHFKIREGVEGRAFVFALQGLAMRLAQGLMIGHAVSEEIWEPVGIEKWCEGAGKMSGMLSAFWGIEAAPYPEAKAVEREPITDPAKLEMMRMLTAAMGLDAPHAEDAEAKSDTGEASAPEKHLETLGKSSGSTPSKATPFDQALEKMREKTIASKAPIDQARGGVAPPSAPIDSQAPNKSDGDSAPIEAVAAQIDSSEPIDNGEGIPPELLEASRAYRLSGWGLGFVGRMLFSEKFTPDDMKEQWRRQEIKEARSWMGTPKADEMIARLRKGKKS